MPRKDGCVSQVNNKEEKLCPYQYGLVLALPQVWEGKRVEMCP